MTEYVVVRKRQSTDYAYVVQADSAEAAVRDVIDDVGGVAHDFRAYLGLKRGEYRFDGAELEVVEE